MKVSFNTHTFLWAVLFATICSCELEVLHQNFDPNTGPVNASFELDSISNGGFDPAQVFFKNTSTGGDTYTWNFGDPASGGNNNSNLKNPEHTYQNPGVYTISLKVENSITDEEKTTSTELTIKETNTFSFTLTPGGSNFMRVWEVLITENGEYLILGGKGNDSDTDLYVDRLDEEGIRLNGYPKEIEVTGKGEARAAFINDAGHIAITGYTNTGGFNDSKLAFFQLDQNMNMRPGFPKNYGDDTRGVGRSIIQTSTGGYAIAGEINGSGITDFFVTMTDGNANELGNFPRQYNEFDFTESASDIKELPNGDFIMIGTDGTLGRLFVNIMDSNGNDKGGSPFYVDGRSGEAFVVLDDGSLMILGRELNRIDQNGNDFPGFPKDLGNRFSGTDIILTRDGDIAFTGQSDDDLVLYRTDLNGNSLPGYPKTFPSTDRSIGNALAQAEDGGFIIVGTVFTSNSRGYVVKTDSQGVIR